MEGCHVVYVLFGRGWHVETHTRIRQIGNRAVNDSNKNLCSDADARSVQEPMLMSREVLTPDAQGDAVFCIRRDPHS
jgi:hypothetical protein